MVRKPRYCCELFCTFTHRIISVDEDGKATEWGSSDQYVTWEERTEGLDFVFCPFCGKKLDHAPQDTNTVTIDGRIIHEC